MTSMGIQDEALGGRRALQRLRSACLEAIAGLHPGYFAMVMATGVLDVACRILGILNVSDGLLWINLASYLVLWILTFLRMILFPKRFLADWSSHQRAPGFFTAIAATCVVGTQLVALGHGNGIARALWWAGLGMWLVFMYAVFAALTVKQDKPSLEDGINGGWLTAVVATQSLCVLGTLVAPDLGVSRDIALFLVLSLWLCGGMLYIWMISFIFYRYTFLRFLPSDLLPPYWINMGAMAISTLAGAMLIRISPGSALLQSLLPFIKGFTLLYWATATWWIPMLLILGVWRHIYRRVPLIYDPLYWGLVFPLAMYTLCTLRLSEAFGLPFLLAIPKIFVAAALTAWSFTFLGLLISLLHTLATALRPARESVIAPNPGLIRPNS